MTVALVSPAPEIRPREARSELQVRPCLVIPSVTGRGDPLPLRLRDTGAHFVFNEMPVASNLQNSALDRGVAACRRSYILPRPSEHEAPLHNNCQAAIA